MSDDEIQYKYGLELYREKEYQKALDTFQKLLHTEMVDDARVWFMAGISAYNLEKYVDALMLFNKAILLNPKHADAHLFKAWTLHINNQEEDALISVVRAFEIEETHAALFLESEILYNLEEYEATLEILQTLLENTENTDEYTQYLNKIAITQNTQENTVDAENTIKEALTIKPDDSELLYTLANIQKTQNKQDEALKTLNNILKIDSEWITPQITIAQIQIGQEEPLKAIKTLNNILKIDSERDDAWYLLALIHYYEMELESALSAIETAIEINFGVTEYEILEKAIKKEL